ncbi:MAG: haloacid dehalogenase [Paenibacillus sp.]|jgi:putative hydrolase of the HAD superfamily|nr:haloacid dehalogenase [Paenibacillus sp.]
MRSVLVFDLDDTLYEEMTYVKSGFLAVANYLYSEFGLLQEETMNVMLNELHEAGRGRVFDTVLKKNNLFNARRIHACLMAYRGHEPTIRLFPDSEICLTRFKASHSLYIVTDGNKLVQHKKLVALDMYQRVTSCYVTHRFGIKNAKPSTHVFHRICSREKVHPDQIIYIGDNPNKDFVGIKKEGFRTVRIMRGNFANLTMPPEYEADVRIESLNEVTPAFIDSLVCSFNSMK